MPSPVGHALGGAIVGLVMAPKRPGSGLSASLAPVASPRSLPDIDFAWGGHNRETHSLGAAVIAGLVVFAWKRNPRLAIAVTLVVGAATCCSTGWDRTTRRHSA